MKLIPVGKSAGNWRYMTPEGQVYALTYDGLVREGGSGGWYAVAIVDGQRTIDADLVPEEHFKTLRAAKLALLSFLEVSR